MLTVILLLIAAIFLPKIITFFLGVAFRILSFFIIVAVMIIFALIIGGNTLNYWNKTETCTTCDPNYHPVGYWNGHKTIYYTEKNNPYPRHPYTSVQPLEPINPADYQK
jgi:uncharacterized SAM-binding protein YcdF (DUF218 family)